MLTAHEIREELIRQLDAKVVKAVDVARHLGIAQARVTEMKNRERQVQQKEMKPLAEFLGLIDGEQSQISPIARTYSIQHLGKVSQGMWMEQTFMEPDDQVFVSYDARPGDPGPDDLFAVTPIGKSMNLRWREEVQLVCRRIPFTDYPFRPGDLVIVERRNHDLHELTCKRLEIDEEGIFWLHSESDQEQFKEPWRIGRPNTDQHDDIEIRIIGKVIRSFVDYDK